MAGERPDLKRIAGDYTRFARDEARGNSPIYEELALAVAASPQLLDFLAALPPAKRQPNLFLAALRHVAGVPDSARDLTRLVSREGTRIRAVILARSTQTNEPGRCAALLPLLARLPQPLALLEVGASAGLCLLPDRYGYNYGRARIDPPTADAPVFHCAVSGAAPLPAALPWVAWRRGVDLNPIDLRSDEETRWLEMLVWPDQVERAQRLRAAIAVARRYPPRVTGGDLLTDLAPLIAAAPQDATLVVFHTAVLPYVTPEKRDAFAAAVRATRAVWISNEGHGVFPQLADRAPPPPASGCFLLSMNGEPLAWTRPHGQSLDWFGPPP